MKPTLYIPCLLLSLLGLGSCKKFVEVSSPANQLDVNSVFTDDKTATAAVVGIYSEMEFYSPVSTYLTLLPGLSADELAYTSFDNSFSEFVTNSYTPNNPYVSSTWGIYRYIYEANSCIERIEKSHGLSSRTKNQLLGEALFSRAFCYFYLVNLFGDVPLVVSTDYRVTDTLGRTASAKVYQQMIADLQKAQSLLTPDYPSAQRVRPNLWTANALLARVYLYNGNWSAADAQASAVIESGLYSLQDVGTVFLNSSNESIWQLMPVIPSLNTQEAFIFIPSAPDQIPNFPLTAGLIGAFEPGDARKSAWTASTVIGTQEFYYPAKYKVSSGSPATEYHIAFRLAEQYLIRAEARIKEGNTIDAIADINTIRSRAGLGGLPASLSPDQAAAAVRQERRIELFAEFGDRWLDLKRSNTTDAVLGGTKPTWRGTAVLWPVPQGQRNVNPHLTQNMGY